MAKTATVNLTTGGISIVETRAHLLRDYLGGRGLGARLLYDLVGPEVDPLGPDNYLIFTAAPLAGTPWPTSARMHVTFKSPPTGVYGYANTGGQIVAQLRHAGYDALLVTGRAPVPSILRVVDDAITIVPAPELWGLQTGAVHDALLGADGKQSKGCVACIGPAGENLVRIAAIINDRGRAAARGGPGAVMGSKNLKALHITATRRPPTSPELRAAAKEATGQAARRSAPGRPAALGHVGADGRQEHRRRPAGQEPSVRPGAVHQRHQCEGVRQVRGRAPRLLRLPDQMQPRLEGRRGRVCGRGGRPGIRDHQRARPHVLGQRPGGDPLRQPALQRIRPGHHLDRRDHGVRPGAAREGAAGR